MKYVAPQERTEAEIIEQLSHTTDEKEISSIALSALYYCPTLSAGRILLYCLKQVTGDCRLYLIIKVTSFMQMHSTNYLYKEFLDEIKKDYPSLACHKEEVDDCIEAIHEFNEMFKNNTPNQNALDH